MTSSIDVIICTHNRAEELKKTLTAVQKCRIPDEIKIRVLVVANACTDDTVAVVNEMNLPVVEEPRPGLAHARNRGIVETDGDAILWFDYDVTPDRGIFLAYAEALQTNPDAGFFGGPIRPVFAAPSPSWIETAVRLVPSSWAGLDLGVSVYRFEKSGKRFPFGANFLVRRSALPGKFNSDFGRDGTTALLTAGEETEMFLRMQDNGISGAWVAGASVQHRIGTDRQTIRYLESFWRGIGVQDVSLARFHPRRQTLRAFRQFVLPLPAALLYLVGRMLNLPIIWIPAFAKMHRALGASAARLTVRR